jgi:2-polyprenyl-3-methyl-5-hydroxy-6-metoxy-1,4-benzoquinol methylase
MQQLNCEKTTQQYWEKLYSKQTVPSLPSNFSVASRDLHRLFRKYILPGMQVLEIGCAPGKQLAYIGKCLKGAVSGIDYSANGIELSRRIFSKLKINADLRCEDIFSTSFASGSFDVVYSLGVIEHFEDPRPLVRRHVDLLKPGGVSLIVVPNYGGIYGRLQRFFDPANLAIHNTDIMEPDAIQQLAPRDICAEVTGSAFGRPSPWLVNFDTKWPAPIARTISYLLNFVGLLMPFEIRPLCPMIVLIITRA